jgi:hypothetical protein
VCVAPQLRTKTVFICLFVPRCQDIFMSTYSAHFASHTLLCTLFFCAFCSAVILYVHFVPWLQIAVEDFDNFWIDPHVISLIIDFDNFWINPHVISLIT